MMPAKTAARVRHARIELPDDDYERLKRSAGRFRLGVAAYIRLSVLERVERDERGSGLRAESEAR